MADFPLDRYRRAGATDDEVAKAQRRFDRMDAATQASFAARVEAGSDYELAQDLEAHRHDPEPEVAPPANPGKGAKPKPSE